MMSTRSGSNGKGSVGGREDNLGTEISPEDAERLIESEKRSIVLDIRSETAFRLSRIKGACHLTEEAVMAHLASRAVEEGDPIVVYCAVGIRSLEVAERLRENGFRNASSIAGGFTGWRVAGAPVVNDSSFSVGQLERYSRNMYLKEIGEAGQIKLMNAKVLLVGAGGLASSAALYLAACGIGTVGIVDYDTVDASNLNRQVLHGVGDVGKPKVESAKSAIARINPDVNTITFAERLSPENVLRIMDGFDVVMDASDNFGTKYLLNDACFLSGKPYVFGGAVGFDGQACVFWPKKGGPCMRCLIPEQPDSRLSPSCSEAGVLGMVPGLIGLVQATEVVKVILQIGTPLIGSFYVYDALNPRNSRLFETGRREDCPLCGESPRITAVSGEGSVEYKGRQCDVA
jgi:molybdopterin/thiamine biosynthesis adenylyltransferase/rhodanese-related sulfurtransferase